jgi:hypothetical protein
MCVKILYSIQFIRRKEAQNLDIFLVAWLYTVKRQNSAYSAAINILNRNRVDQNVDQFLRPQFFHT